MRIWIFIFAVVCLGILPFARHTAFAQEQTAVAPRTLKDLFDLALKNSERIAISEESVRQAEALYRETLGGALPELTYRRQATLQDDADTSHDGLFRLAKTDLTGYRELAAVRAGRSTINQRQFEMQRVEQLVFQDIAEAFYALLLAEENVEATQRLIDLARARLGELNERVRIGRARPTDALAQEVLMTSLESQMEESLRQVKARRDLLAFLVGLGELENEVAQLPLDVEFTTLDYYLEKAPERPDIQALQANVNAYKSLRHAARAEFFPSLNGTANSYTDHVRSQDTDDWDVTLSVSLPVWDWGSRGGTLRAADAVYNQAQQTFALGVRQAQLEIRNAYRDYQSMKRQLEIRTKSVELARRDYQIQSEDERRGLVSSLEVFESLDRLNNAELAFNNARLQEKLGAINLEITSGAKPQAILNETQE